MGAEDKVSRVFPKVMITGHRPRFLSTEGQSWAQREILKTMKRLRKFHGLQEAISGMALGADTWWAESSLSLGVPLAAYIPFESQSDMWNATDRKRWRELRASASREIVLGDHYDVGLLFARNDAMLRDSDLCVALWRQSEVKGGTADTVRKARAAGKPLIILDPETHLISTENF